LKRSGERFNVTTIVSNGHFDPSIARVHRFR
jgi:hypothetical protein